MICDTTMNAPKKRKKWHYFKYNSTTLVDVSPKIVKIVFLMWYSA